MTLRRLENWRRAGFVAPETPMQDPKIHAGSISGGQVRLQSFKPPDTAIGLSRMPPFWISP